MPYDPIVGDYTQLSWVLGVAANLQRARVTLSNY